MSVRVPPPTTLSMSDGNAVTSTTTTTNTTIAPSVRARALPFFFTKPLGSSASWATWMPLISAAMPPDALHKRDHDRDREGHRDTGTVGVDDRRELEVEETLDFLGQRTGDALDLVLDVRRIGNQTVDRHHRDERGDEREEAVERDPGRHERGVVRPQAARESLPGGYRSRGQSHYECSVTSKISSATSP